MNWIVPILRIALILNMGECEVMQSPSGYYFTSTLPEQTFITDVTAGIKLFKHISIESQTLIYTAPPWITDRVYQFIPYQADFYVRAYAKFGPLTAGIEHLCTHPILSGGGNWDKRYGGRNSIYVIYEAKFD